MFEIGAEAQFEGEIAPSASPFEVALDAVFEVGEGMAAQEVGVDAAVHHVVVFPGVALSVAEAEGELALFAVGEIVAGADVEVVGSRDVVVALVHIGVAAVGEEAHQVLDFVAVVVGIVDAESDVVAIVVELVRQVAANHSEGAVVVVAAVGGEMRL